MKCHSFKCDLRSELLLDRSSWNIINTIWLLHAVIAWNLNTNPGHLSITNERHRATAIGGIWSHRVEASDHGDDTTVKEDESKPTDGNHAVEKDLVLRLPPGGLW